MPPADATARTARPSQAAILRVLEQIALAERARRSPRASGFFAVVDEFAGLDRLDREELDEDE